MPAGENSVPGSGRRGKRPRGHGAGLHPDLCNVTRSDGPGNGHGQQRGVAGPPGVTRGKPVEGFIALSSERGRLARAFPKPSLFQIPSYFEVLPNQGNAINTTLLLTDAFSDSDLGHTWVCLNYFNWFKNQSQRMQ